LRHLVTRSSSRTPLHQIGFTLPGWREEAPQGDRRYWRDHEGNVLSLAVPEERIGYPYEWNEREQQQWCRDVASSRGAGLIEVQIMPSAVGQSASFIYKRREGMAYIYTGIFIIDIHSTSAIWTIVAGEHGTTGQRDAVVTLNSLNTGMLTLDDYNQWWAQDPYEPSFCGVDKSVLRFMSDDKIYDKEFPWHPLSKVRHLLASLPNSVQWDMLKH
jgi:hypothetical protein